MPQINYPAKVDKVTRNFQYKLCFLCGHTRQVNGIRIGINNSSNDGTVCDKH